MFGWLKLKPRNRRSRERGVRLLDVKLRTRQTRAARVRWAAGTFFGIAIAALVCFGAWRGGQALLNRLIYESPSFTIENVDVQTDGVLAPEVIRRWAMVHRGQNLFALDLMKVKRDLEMRPVIEFAAVERILPHTLKIAVNEREPLALAKVAETRKGGGSQEVIYNFDQDGCVMRPLDAGWRMSPVPTNETLPELIGVSANEVQPGRKVESPQVLAALALLSELNRSPMAGMADLLQINVAAPEVLEATTSQGAHITFSLDHFGTQLRRWRQIHDSFQRWGKSIVSLDLSVSNNLPVQSVAIALTPPAAPVKIAKPLHGKKKNV
jgi:cell division septal protein FtsQ